MRLLKGLGRPRGRVPLCIRSTSRFLSFSADGPGIQHAGLWSSGEATGLYVYYIHDYNTKGTEISVKCIQLLQKHCGSFVLFLELWNIYASLVSALRSFIFLCRPVPTKSFCVVAFISVLFRSQAQLDT